MKITVLQGNVRNSSNTEIIVNQFLEEMDKCGILTERIIIKDLHIEHCSACWTCQDIFEEPGCPKKDDMDVIYRSVVSADCIIFATPIYSWYCTPPLKSVMDRLVYGMNKYYGEEEGPCLWEGKLLGLITTCGYEIEDGVGVYEEGLKRYSKHSRLKYIGKLAIRDVAGKEYFRSAESRQSINDFAKKVMDEMNTGV